MLWMNAGAVTEPNVWQLRVRGIWETGELMQSSACICLPVQADRWMSVWWTGRQVNASTEAPNKLAERRRG